MRRAEHGSWVPHSAFRIPLSATASALGAVPAGAVALLLGVDRIVDLMRVLTNLLGNCVAVFVVSRWEGALDAVRARQVLDGAPDDRTDGTAPDGRTSESAPVDRTDDAAQEHRTATERAEGEPLGR